MKLKLVRENQKITRQSISHILSATGAGIYVSDGHWGMSTTHGEDASGVFGIFGGELANVVVDIAHPTFHWSSNNRERGLINPRKIDLDLSELEAV